MRMKIIIVISLLIGAVWLSGCVETDSHPEPVVKYVYVKETPIPKPKPTPIPTSTSTSTSSTGPLHAIVNGEQDDPVYMNYNSNVEEDIKEVCSEFSQYMPTYMEDEVDCDDMAVFLWNKLQEKGVKTFIVVGRVDGEETPFSMCDHAWLVCQTPGGSMVIEPTLPAVIYSNGYLVFSSPAKIEEILNEGVQEGNISREEYEYIMNNEDVKKEIFERYKSTFVEDPTIFDRYRYGFYYAKPSDMRADIGDRW